MAPSTETAHRQFGLVSSNVNRRRQVTQAMFAYAKLATVKPFGSDLKRPLCAPITDVRADFAFA
jgi:hypothetical protein